MADMAVALPPRRLRALLLRARLVRRLLGSATFSATTALASSSTSIPIAARPCILSTAFTSALLLGRGGASGSRASASGATPVRLRAVIGVGTLVRHMAFLSAFKAFHGR